MTMDNGEGRPLDEEAADGEDPQGWYFDLPGGAWERQEEKNRTLRQRVLGNLSDDAEKAKNDPFARKLPEVDAPAKGGLFGLGRKKNPADAQRESAGGTWALSRTNEPDEDQPETDNADEADEWSTEIPLRLAPATDLTLRRHTEAEQGEPWAAADAGWSIGAEAGDAAAELTSEEDQDFRKRIQFWARGTRSEPATEGDEPAGEMDEGDVAGATAASFVAAVAPEGEGGFADGDNGETEERASDDKDFISEMRSWAAASADDEPAKVPEEEPELEPAQNDVLQLRPRTSEPGEKRLDWSFQPAGWSEGADRESEFVLEAGEGAGLAGEPEETADMLESMRKWAERTKDSEHPHFALQHHDTDEDVAERPPVIPLRPRHHDDSEEPAAEVVEPHSPAPPLPDEPRTIPIVLRSRTEPQPDPRMDDPDAAPTRWDEFFGLSKPGDNEPAEEEETGLTEGLAAMRDWAQKRPDAETEHEIPEEFLEPFDWELHEDKPAPAANEAPSEPHEPFSWELEAEEDTAEAAEPLASVSPDTNGTAEAIERAEPAPEPVAEMVVPGEAGDDLADGDPLAGLFDHPELTAPAEKKKGGMFGRLFGRKQKQSGPEPDAMDDAPGDWVLPAKMRTWGRSRA